MVRVVPQEGDNSLFCNVFYLSTSDFIHLENIAETALACLALSIPYLLSNGGYLGG